MTSDSGAGPKDLKFHCPAPRILTHRRASLKLAAEVPNFQPIRSLHSRPTNLFTCATHLIYHTEPTIQSGPMKRFARLQNRPFVPEARSCLQERKFATNSEHVDVAPKPQAQAQAQAQTQAQSETAGLDKPRQEDFIFDGPFEVNTDEKTINTAVGSLPLSPLLDPKWRAARARVKVKALPNKLKLNRFQRQLYQNPFGEPQTSPGVCG